MDLFKLVEEVLLFSSISPNISGSQKSTKKAGKQFSNIYARNKDISKNDFDKQRLQFVFSAGCDLFNYSKALTFLKNPFHERLWNRQFKLGMLADAFQKSRVHILKGP